MGQQQLLLLTLGIVIVGLATVVGLNAFAQNSKSSALDTAAVDASRLATYAVAWKAQPCMLGGGACESKFFGFEFQGYDFGTDIHAGNGVYEDTGTQYRGIDYRGLAGGAFLVQVVDTRAKVAHRFWVYGPDPSCWAAQTGAWKTGTITPGNFWVNNRWTLTPASTPGNPDDTACSWS